MGTKEKNWIIFLIFMLCGIVIGGLLGELSNNIDMLKWLSYGEIFGTKTPVTLDLGILQLTIGITLKINIASIVGMLLASFIYKKF